MLKRVFAVLTVLVLFVLTGCQMEAEYWVNADGSGKFECRATVQKQYMDAEPGVEVENYLASIAGIGNWESVEYQDQGEVVKVKATGYFQDVAQVRYNRGGYLMPVFIKENGKVTGVEFKPAGGGMPASKGPALTKEQALEKAKAEGPGLAKRQKEPVGMSRRIADMNMASRVTYIIHLPGEVKESSVLEAEHGTVKFVMDGAKTFNGYVGILEKPEELAKVIEAGEKAGSLSSAGPVFNNMITERVYGKPGPVKATITPGADLVDYAAVKGKAGPSLFELTTKAGMVSKQPEAERGFACKWDVIQVNNGRIGAGTGQGAMLKLKGTLESPYYALGSVTFTKVTNDKGEVLIPGKKSRSTRVSRGEMNPKAEDYRTTVSGTKEVDLETECLPLVEKFGLIEGYVTVLAGERVEMLDIGDLKCDKDGVGKAEGMGFEGVVSGYMEGVGNRKNFGMFIQMKTTDVPVRFLIEGAEGSNLTIDVWAQIPWKLGSKYIWNLMTGKEMSREFRVRVWVVKGPRLVRVPFRVENAVLEKTRELKGF